MEDYMSNSNHIIRFTAENKIIKKSLFVQDTWPNTFEK